MSTPAASPGIDPTEQADLLLRDLHTDVQWGIAFELAFTAALIYVLLLQEVFGTASLGLDAVLFVVPFPFIVWGADELRRWLLRRRG